MSFSWWAESYFVERHYELESLSAIGFETLGVKGVLPSYVVGPDVSKMVLPSICQLYFDDKPCAILEFRSRTPLGQSECDFASKTLLVIHPLPADTT